MKFKYKATIEHVFIHVEEFTVHITDAPEEEGEALAREKAYRDAIPSRFDAEHEETNVEWLELISAMPQEGEKDIQIRCDKTKDMFNEKEKHNG